MYHYSIIYKQNLNVSNKKREIKNEVSKLVEISYFLLFILSRSTKNELEKSKFYQKKGMKPVQDNSNKGIKLYAQASSPNINEVLKIKENFPNLLVKKIKNIQKTINKLRKEKPYINIMIKGPSKRQVIILMDNNNILKFMISSSAHIANINRTLKNIKSDIVADFACANHHRLIITTNKVALSFNLYTIKNYIKNVDNIELNDIMTSYLPQLKFYLKNIPYLI